MTVRTYIEARQTDGTDWVRAEVTDMSEGDQASVQTKVEAIMSGKNYTEVEHVCRHDEFGLCDITVL